MSVPTDAAPEWLRSCLGERCSRPSDTLDAEGDRAHEGLLLDGQGGHLRAPYPALGGS